MSSIPGLSKLEDKKYDKKPGIPAGSAEAEGLPERADSRSTEEKFWANESLAGARGCSRFHMVLLWLHPGCIPDKINEIGMFPFTSNFYRL